MNNADGSDTLKMLPMKGREVGAGSGAWHLKFTANEKQGEGKGRERVGMNEYEQE